MVRLAVFPEALQARFLSRGYGPLVRPKTQTEPSGAFTLWGPSPELPKAADGWCLPTTRDDLRDVLIPVLGDYGVRAVNPWPACLAGEAARLLYMQMSLYNVAWANVVEGERGVNLSVIELTYEGLFGGNYAHFWWDKVTGQPHQRRQLPRDPEDNGPVFFFDEDAAKLPMLLTLARYLERDLPPVAALLLALWDIPEIRVRAGEPG